MTRDPVKPFDETLVDRHLDAVLRAAGSGLRYYSLPSVREAMRAALRAAMDEAWAAAPGDRDAGGARTLLLNVAVPALREIAAIRPGAASPKLRRAAQRAQEALVALEAGALEAGALETGTLEADA